MKLLRANKNFRFFLASNTLTAIGSVLFNLIFIVYAEQMENPKLAISAVVIVSTIPVVGDFIFGYFSDRTVNKYKAFLLIKIIQAVIYILFAFLMSFHPNWTILGCLLLLNFLSDGLSSYNVYLEIPMIKKMIKPEYLTDARAISNGIHKTIDLLGQVFGASLIVLLNYQFYLAGLINAILFSLSFYLLWLNRKNFVAIIRPENHYEGETFHIRALISDSVNNFKILFQYKKIFHFTLIFALMNLISSAQDGLLLISYSDNPNLLFYNFAFTLMIYTTAEALGIILGSVVPLTIFRRTSIEINLIFEVVITVLLILNILLIEERFSLLILMFFSGYFMGVSNPRIDAFIMQTLPDKVISSVTSIFYTLVQITLPVGTVVFLAISNLFTVKTAWFFLSMIGVSLLLYSILLSRKYYTKPESL